MTRLQTVVELPEFLRQAGKIMSDAERGSIVSFLAANPETGVSLGGGLRKVPVPRENSGKSGGYRTIYIFGGTHMPIFLLTVFAKNTKSNLTQKERATAVKLSKQIVENYAAKPRS